MPSAKNIYLEIKILIYPRTNIQPMQRRDILNIFFNRNASDQPVTTEPDPVVLTPAHLRTDNSIPFFKAYVLAGHEWQIPLEVSGQFAFTITMGLKCFSTAEHELNVESANPDRSAMVKTSIGAYNESFVFITGLKRISATEQNDINQTHLNTAGIALGFRNGYLFIGDVQDIRLINQEKFTEGLQLTLTVNPLSDGKTYAKLKVTDQSGLMLSVVKSKQFTITDWDGEIVTGTYYQSACIEGRQPIKHELI